MRKDGEETILPGGEARAAGIRAVLPCFP